MLTEFIEKLSSINIDDQIVSKILTTLVLVVAVIIITKSLGNLLSRWEKRITSKLEKRAPSVLSTLI